MDYLNLANIVAITVPFVVIVIDRVHKLSVTQLPLHTGNQLSLQCERDVMRCQ